jgi:post-segregation antitoxin (ccd killing protein)
MSGESETDVIRHSEGVVMTSVSIPLRVSAEYADNITRAARDKGLSVNRLFIEAMDAYLKAEEDKAWVASFEAMADDPEMVDVEYARFAQAEVMLANK